MVLTKYFSLFGLSVSVSKNIFTFNCGFLNDSNNLFTFGNCIFKKSRACKNFKIFCPSFLTLVALYMT